MKDDFEKLDYETPGRRPQSGVTDGVTTRPRYVLAGIYTASLAFLFRLYFGIFPLPRMHAAPASFGPPPDAAHVMFWLGELVAIMIGFIAAVFGMTVLINDWHWRDSRNRSSICAIIGSLTLAVPYLIDAASWFNHNYKF